MGKHGDLLDRLVVSAATNNCGQTSDDAQHDFFRCLDPPDSSETRVKVSADDSDDLFSSYNASFWVQFVLLYRRSLMCATRDTVKSLLNMF